MCNADRSRLLRNCDFAAYLDFWHITCNIDSETLKPLEKLQMHVGNYSVSQFYMTGSTISAPKTNGKKQTKIQLISLRKCFVPQNHCQRYALTQTCVVKSKNKRTRQIENMRGRLLSGALWPYCPKPFWFSVGLWFSRLDFEMNASHLTSIFLWKINAPSTKRKQKRKRQDNTGREQRRATEEVESF